MTWITIKKLIEKKTYVRYTNPILTVYEGITGES